jgi:hypothetical protein
MFEDLEEHMKRDERREIGPNGKFLEWTVASILAVLVIAGLYFVSLF